MFELWARYGSKWTWVVIGAESFEDVIGYHILDLHNDADELRVIRREEDRPILLLT